MGHGIPPHSITKHRPRQAQARKKVQAFQQATAAVSDKAAIQQRTAAAAAAATSEKPAIK